MSSASHADAPAIGVADFDRWLIKALPGQRIAYLNGAFAPRNFPVSKAVRDADVAGLVHCFFNARHVPPSYMAQRTSKLIPPGLSARIGGGPSPLAPADADAVMAAVEFQVGQRGILPPASVIAAAAGVPAHRVRAALNWLIAHGLLIIKSIIIGTQRRRYVILS